MINEERTYQQIEDFLNDRMSDHEKIEFQSNINSNNELKKLVDQHSAAGNYLKAQGLMDFKSKLKAGMPNATKKSNSSKFILIGFVSILAIVGGLYYYNLGNSNEAIEQEIIEVDISKNESEVAEIVSLDDSNKKKSDFRDNDETDGSIKTEVESNSNNISENEKHLEKPIKGINKRLGTGNDIEANKDEILPEKKSMDKVEITDEVVDAKLDCDKFDPRADLKERASFNSLGEGKIEIENKNREQSYFIYIDENTRQKDKAVFEHLEQGSYKVSIENQDGCVYIKKYTLIAKKVD